MIYVWLALMIATIILEATTVQLVSIWFSIGAFAAFLVSLFTDNSQQSAIVIQIIVFVVTSLIALIVTRPLVKKFTKAKIQPTNADRFIGTAAIVTEDINNNLGAGQVNSKGSFWSARSVNGEMIPAGSNVRVERIDGNKLIVSLLTLSNEELLKN